MSDSGTGSLRDAITNANSAPGSTITFQAGLTGTITLASALPPITVPVIIQGPGPSVITVDGANAYRPFTIKSAVGTVTISGLTVAHGSDKLDSNGGGNFYVGAPGSSSSLVANFLLSNCTIYAGSTIGNGGAGIFNNFSNVTVTNCTFVGNSAPGTTPNGGAINNNFGVVTLTNCTLAGNSANGNGGAILNYAIGGNANLTMTNCTVAGNTAKGSGGGILNDAGNVNLTNCIVYGDVEPAGGGDLATVSGVITANHCDVQGGVPFGTNGTFNISGNPILGNLANNGGLTQTMALGSGSPALGAGTTFGAPSADQRGFVRPSPPSIGAWDSGTVVATGQQPIITSLNPSTIIAGSGAFTLNIVGTGFVPVSTVSFGGLTLTPTLNPNGTLSVLVPASAILQIGPVAVQVINSASAGGASAPSTFTVLPLSPTITTITPNLGPQGSSTFDITIKGTNFTPTAYVSFAGTVIPSIYHSSLLMTATIPGSLLTTVGSYAVTVSTTGSAGATSIPQFFSVFKPIITIASLNPPQVTAGSPGFTLAIFGTNFMPGAVVSFGFQTVTATYVSSTEIDALIPASLIATAISYPVTVTNPVAAGGATSTVFFTVTTAHTFPAGLALISLPTSYPNQSVQQIFGYANPVLAIWDPASNVYDTITGSNTTALVPGKGFWIRFPQSTAIAAQGVPSPPVPFSIALSAGWNMIGDPFLSQVPLSSITVAPSGGGTETYSAAIASGLIDSPVYEYATNPSRYILAGSLEPYAGAWLHVTGACTLIVPNP